jgi:hypothetical protein
MTLLSSYGQVANTVQPHYLEHSWKNGVEQVMESRCTEYEDSEDRMKWRVGLTVPRLFVHDQ